MQRLLCLLNHENQEQRKESSPCDAMQESQSAVLPDAV